MPAIVLERALAATPARVYAALTQPGELARWWTNDLSACAEVDSVAEFRFNQGLAVRRLIVAELVAGERVRWQFQQGPAHWAGTSICWDLAPASCGTHLVMTHDGFTTTDALVHQTRVEWAFYLDSLTSYLETGTGTPYIKGELDPL